MRKSTRRLDLLKLALITIHGDTRTTSKSIVSKTKKRRKSVHLMLQDQDRFDGEIADIESIRQIFLDFEASFLSEVII